MSWIAPITYETASPEVREILDHKEKDYLERCSKFAYQLRNHVVYDSVETNAWRMDGEVQRVVGKRYGDLLEYYVSLENGAVIAVPYYKKCLMDAGIDPDHTVFDEKDRSVIDFAKAIAGNKGHVPTEVKTALKKYFTEEQIAVLAGMAVVCNADNLYENIFEVE